MRILASDNAQIRVSPGQWLWEGMLTLGVFLYYCGAARRHPTSNSRHTRTFLS